MEEIWKQCTLPTLEHVRVSNLGNVHVVERMSNTARKGIYAPQLRPAKAASPWIAQNGYYTVAFKVNGVRKKYLVHRLVALAFIPNIRKCFSVNHIDCNKLNNRVDNLEWCTLAENTRMQWRDGLIDSDRLATKLSQKLADEIREIAGKAKDVAAYYGISDSMVYAIRNRKRWKG